MREMTESGSDLSSLSSVTDDDSINDSDDYLSSEESNADYLAFLAEDAEVLPYRFEPDATPEPRAGYSLVEIEADREEEEYTTQIGNFKFKQSATCKIERGCQSMY